MNPKGKQIALTAMALSAVATISAVTQDDIDRLRAQAGAYEQEVLVAVPQRVAGLQGQTRAFLAPSVEAYEEQLNALERTFALEQEVLRSLELQEIAAVLEQEARALEEQEVIEQQAGHDELAEIVVEELAKETEQTSAPGFLRSIRNRIAALLGRD